MRIKRKIGSPKRRGRLRPEPSMARAPWKQLERDLELFRTAVDASPDHIYLIDPAAMRYVYVNDTALRASGYTRDELLKLRPGHLTHQKPLALKRIYAEVIAKGEQGVAIEHVGLSKDGRRGWFETHRRAVRLGDRWLIIVV